MVGCRICGCKREKLSRVFHAPSRDSGFSRNDRKIATSSPDRPVDLKSRAGPVARVRGNRWVSVFQGVPMALGSAGEAETIRREPVRLIPPWWRPGA